MEAGKRNHSESFDSRTSSQEAALVANQPKGGENEKSSSQTSEGQKTFQPKILISNTSKTPQTNTSSTVAKQQVSSIWRPLHHLFERSYTLPTQATLSSTNNILSSSMIIDEPTTAGLQHMLMPPPALPLELKRQKTCPETTGTFNSNLDPCFSRLAQLLGKEGGALSTTQKMLAIRARRAPSTKASSLSSSNTLNNNLAYCIPIWDDEANIILKSSSAVESSCQN